MTQPEWFEWALRQFPYFRERMDAGEFWINNDDPDLAETLKGIDRWAVRNCSATMAACAAFVCGFYNGAKRGSESRHRFGQWFQLLDDGNARAVITVLQHPRPR